jgi:calcineurin-like phosphoesterase family protein
MPAIFVHVSDIHFGQERDERLHIHNDVKEQLIADAAEVIRSLPGGIAHGILVSGDIAQAGKREQYELAGKWLDDLAEAVGCEIFRIQMVPGNHDLDRDRLSVAGEHVLNVIRYGGPTEYEKILGNETDRATLYARFGAYGRFCEGYDCLLDEEGRYSTNLHVELAPGRSVRFVRMNSALLCTGAETDTEPELMVGARQFVIPRKAGEEVVVLMHHPLHWFKDSADAKTYLTSRARVLISGHEHNPKVTVEPVGDGSDFMMLAAGATVPYKSNATYTFTYNVIEFDWDQAKDALAVKIHARTWNPVGTCFESDDIRLGLRDPSYVLGSPNFRKGVTPAADEPKNERESISQVDRSPIVEMVTAGAGDVQKGAEVPPEVDGYRLLLLRFFRDLTEGERLRVLVGLDAVSADSDEPMTQAIERQLFDWLVGQGRLSEIEREIDALLATKEGGQG